MSEISIRQMVGCLKPTNQPPTPQQGTLSLLNHFFGYTSVPETQGKDISVRRQASLLRGLHFHINLIYVGLDQHTKSIGLVNRDHDDAIAYARRLFAGAGMGIGRIKRFQLVASKAQGFDHLESPSEARELRDCFSTPEEFDGIDVFVVRSYSNEGVRKGGNSPVGGSCDHEGKRSGAVVVVEGGRANFVHEIGHYLGLDHPDDHDVSNLNDPMLEGTSSASAKFTAEQGGIMRDHCMKRPPCP